LPLLLFNRRDHREGAESRQCHEVARQQKMRQDEILALQKKEADGLIVMADARRSAAENALDPQLVFEKKLQAWKEVEVAKYQYMSQSRLVPMVQMGTGCSGPKKMP